MRSNILIRASLAQRDTLLMCLLLDHGLRVGEVAILKKTDINLTNKLLTFDRPKVSKGDQLAPAD